MGLALGFALLAFTPKGAFSQTNQNDAAAIEKQFRSWQDALVSRDRPKLNEIASPQYSEVVDGDTVERDVAIGMPTTSPDYHVEEVQIERFTVNVSGDEAKSESI